MPPRRLAYMPGIDGLRAFAVGAVLIYHLGAPWLPGGYLGVDMFLVISGFLITSLLLSEHDATGRIDLRRFWIRRARRLLPAVLVMIGVVLVAMLVLHAGEVSRLRGQVLAALFYVVNWQFIYADVPYFDQFGRPSVFLHLWSLAIEEQFYLVWPPIMAVGIIALRRRALLALVLALAAGSTLLAWVMWKPFTDPSRIYYGTDTRAVALLVGVALALIPWALRDRSGWSPAARRALELVGWACAAGLLAAMCTLGDLDEHLYRGGFLVIALLTAGVVAVLADSTAPMARAAAWAPLVWIGLRSYSIYLWHWPVIMLTRPGVDVPLHGAPLVILRLALTMAAAMASYRFVEVPFRRHGVAGVRERLSRRGRPVRLAAATSAALAVVGLAVAVAVVPASTTSVPGIDVASAGEPPAATGTAATKGPELVFVGDSVMLGASRTIESAFGRRAVVDAAVGRRFPEGARILEARLAKLPPDAIPVIHLGNNDFIDPADLDALLARLAGRPRVVLLTVRVPLPWQDSVNRAIRAAPGRFPNVQVIDWYAASGGPGLLVDGAHMNQKGMRLYGHILEDALGPGGADPATTTGGA
ncbi:MAG: acyltransferase family protein [Thermoleophilia bacterium]